MALLGSGSQLLEDTSTFVDQGDHDVFAHYVTKEDQMQAAVFGTPVIALCGKIWLPTKNPENYQVCPSCKEIYEEMQ